ncbi:2-hydroxyhepta-2,4-diene-1,7-dioate isomerase [Sinomonas cyclohexanicum]|uniref:2-hydroxyhepta-2,4-diene-1,7-dioate isomerase n=1 Tax=Sinomonas cyclohexanicum TaxID=322009 RepID=A0ABM7PQA8_SINCY|nr:fumarylacetoacetate hydrolase family protein [Corynebacterium cyclohexanicum]BCT74357.1 2-hydroxyhepta-2,4-diene-1,7-dioate isomerase [Corynebacterium cyclohexanicum]
MDLATIRTAEGTTAAVRSGDRWLPLGAPDLSALLADPSWRTTAEAALASSGPDAGVAQADAELALPLPAPAKVICCGLNYADHITEMGRDLPEHPTLFAKFADTLTGPTDEIAVPPAAQGALDWEAELAVVIGTELRGAGEDEARAGIAGYTLANDISVRDWQKRTLQWFQGKAWDATNPLGPVLVTADAVDPEDGINITCEVNGIRRQTGNTKTLVFSAAALVAYISQFTVLRPGDVILTGTSGGVGMGMQPPQYLADGDTVVVEAEGLGRLANTIRFTD